MKKYIYFLGAIITLLTSCAGENKSSSADTLTITIDGTKDQKIALADYISRIDSLELKTNADSYLSAIEDFCITDSSLYVLDRNKAVFRFNRMTGQQEMAASKSGHGNGEYIEPKRMVFRDKELHILDMAKNAVMIYDSEMNYKESVNISFSAFDFAIVSDGYLFYNLGASDGLKRIVYTNFSGKVLDSYLEGNGLPEVLYTNKFFSEDEEGNVYFNDPLTDDIYWWTNHQLTVFAHMDYQTNKEEEHKGTNTLSFLATNRMVVSSYLCDRFVLTSIYDKNSNQSASGFAMTGTRFPFMPQKVYQGHLYAIFEDPMPEQGYKTFLLIYNSPS